MKLTLAETKYFRDSISIIADLVTDARFEISKEAISLVAMDPANVAMVIFKLLSTTFIEYKVDKETKLTINLNSLKQVLRRIKPNDTLTLEEEDNKLKITLKSSTKRTFFLPILELEEKEQKIPSLDFKAHVETLSSILNDAIEDADIIGESVSFIVEPKKFMLSATGDLNKAVTEIDPDKITHIETKDPVKAKYSVEYLKKMIQGSKIADKVALKLGKDYPLRLDYGIKDKVQLSFILAPRVEND